MIHVLVKGRVLELYAQTKEEAEQLVKRLKALGVAGEIIAEAPCG